MSEDLFCVECIAAVWQHIKGRARTYRSPVLNRTLLLVRFSSIPMAANTTPAQTFPHDFIWGFATGKSFPRARH